MISIDSNNLVPIGMLIAEVTFFSDDSAEIFGFWYYKEKTLPETREEKQIILTDFAMGRCCKLRLTGSSHQIEDILLSVEWNPSLNDSWFSRIEEVIEQGKKHKFTSIGLENLFKPKGTSVPINLSVRLRQDMNSVIRKLHSGDNEVILEIAHDWNLTEEVRNYLGKIAN